MLNEIPTISVAVVVVVVCKHTLIHGAVKPHWNGKQWDGKRYWPIEKKNIYTNTPETIRKYFFFVRFRIVFGFGWIDLSYRHFNHSTYRFTFFLLLSFEFLFCSFFPSLSSFDFIDLCEHFLWPIISKTHTYKNSLKKHFCKLTKAIYFKTASQQSNLSSSLLYYVKLLKRLSQSRQNKRNKKFMIKRVLSLHFVPVSFSSYELNK